MENSGTDMEELQKLQRDASERRAQRNEERCAAIEAEAQQTAEESPEFAADNSISAASDTGQNGVEAEFPAPAFGQQFDALLQELEDAAKERPILALFAAFSAGVIVGQIFSRKQV